MDPVVRSPIGSVFPPLQASSRAIQSRGETSRASRHGLVREGMMNVIAELVRVDLNPNFVQVIAHWKLEIDTKLHHQVLDEGERTTPLDQSRTVG